MIYSLYSFYKVIINVVIINVYDYLDVGLLTGNNACMQKGIQEKCKFDKMQKTTKCKFDEMQKTTKCEFDKMQNQHNVNIIKCKYNKMQIQQNENETKWKHDKNQIRQNANENANATRYKKDFLQ